MQGNPVSAATPASGQTLQWNGSAWVPGAIPSGGSGGGGLVYYLNYQNTTGISPTTGLPTSPVAVSQLGRNYSVGSGSSTSANLTNGSYSLVCGFVTIVGEPNVTEIPAGLWDFNIWADVSASSGAQTQFQIRIYKYDSTAGTYTSLANSDDIYIYDPSAIVQYIGNVTMPQTTLLVTDRIYIELWAQKNVTGTRQVSFYFDSLHPSHCHTTLPSVSGSGVVKVVNGVFQSPASTIVNADVSATAAIEVSKLSQATNRILGRTTAGTGSVEELSVAGNLTLASGTLTSASTDIQIFATPGAYTWNKPANAKSVHVAVISGGGGGGSGQMSAAATPASGGGGGGAGARSFVTLSAALLGASENGNVGAGGAGGASVTSVGLGINGSPGTPSNFGLWAYADRGGNGTGGAAGAGGSAGSGGGRAIFIGGTGANGSAAGAGSNAGGNTGAGGGGGGGGGTPGSVSAGNGGNGGLSTLYNGSATAPGAGVNGPDVPTNTPLNASGGGGGTASFTAPAMAGGNGGLYGAGGGGGGGGSGFASGKGGNGSQGIVVVTTYF